MPIPRRTTVPGTGLGTAPGVALFVTAVVGPGILTLPAAAAATAGPLSLVALGVLLAMSVPAAFAFVAIHRAAEQRAPGTSGGIHQYVRLAFGPLAARIVGYWFFLGVPLGVPALALIGGSYVSAAVGGGRGTTLLAAWVIAGVAIVAALAGGRAGGLLPLVLAVVLVVLIVGSAAASAPRWDTANLTPFAPNGLTALVPASLTLMWVLTGWEASTNFTSLLRDPARRLPRVIGLTLVVVVVLYASVALPEILVLGPFAGHTEAPVAEVLHAAIGAPASVVAAALAAVLALANAVAYLASLRELGTSLVSAPARTRLPVLVPAGISFLGLAAATVFRLDVRFFVEVCAGSQIPVYVAALASGIVLIPRRSRGWWTALVATIAVALLLVPAGAYLAVPAVIATVVLAGAAIRGRRP